MIYPFYFVRIFALVFLSVEFDFLLIRFLEVYRGLQYISSHP
jgi:hypothetical protein